MKFLWLACVLAVLIAPFALRQRDQVLDLLRTQKWGYEHRRFLSELGQVERLPEIGVPMADGIRLATDVYLPEGIEGPYPAIMMRLPYGKRRFGEVRQWLRTFLPQGYAVVVQDMRGRYNSGGTFAPWPDEARDGAATLDWIAAQAWSNGRVGTIGCSALGETQMLLATRNHPAHAAMIPVGAGGAIGSLGGSHGYFGVFDGGILNLASAFGWFAEAGGKSHDRMAMPRIDYAKGLSTLPVRDAVARFREDETDFRTFLDRFEDEAYWEEAGYVTADDRFSTPFLMVDSWYDRARETLLMARQMRQSGAKGSVVILPGLHCDLGGALREGRVGDVALDPAQARDFDEIFLAFMNHRLKGGPAPDLPPVLYYMMGENRWREAVSWPPAAATRRTMHLIAGAGGGRLSIRPPERDGALVFTSDPANPVPTLGGTMCCTGEADVKAGPIVQNPIEKRGDLLVLTGPALKRPLDLTGAVTARLRVSADVPDTDLIVRLTDVDPDGRSVLVTEGSLRLRYRDGVDRPMLMEPGEIYPVEVILRDIAWQVPAGHRLRLHIAGSSFPRLARNMNGGGDPYAEAVPHTARVTIHSSAEAPSSLSLTVLAHET